MNDIPDDDNRNILKQLSEAGDSLSQPRIIEFQFIFPERSQSLDFARAVDEKEYEVCLSYYKECSCWQAEVKAYMVPTHTEITEIELNLSERAHEVGGKADGWCCVVIDDKNRSEA